VKRDGHLSDEDDPARTASSRTDSSTSASNERGTTSGPICRDAVASPFTKQQPSVEDLSEVRRLLVPDNTGQPESRRAPLHATVIAGIADGGAGLKACRTAATRRQARPTLPPYRHDRGAQVLGGCECALAPTLTWKRKAFARSAAADPQKHKSGRLQCGWRSERANARATGLRIRLAPEW
jgi:hypothetical protein